jgi:hypothetical protein
LPKGRFDPVAAFDELEGRNAALKATAMTDFNDIIGIEQPELHEVLERVRPQMLALANSELLPVNLDPEEGSAKEARQRTHRRSKGGRVRNVYLSNRIPGFGSVSELTNG